TITTVAGTGSFGYGGDGGPATAAELEHPVGVALDGAGNLFIAQAGSHDNGERVRRVDAGTGTITTVTGGSVPVGVALDGAGNLFIAEEGERYPDYYYGARIRRVGAATGTVAAVALDGAGHRFTADVDARVRRVDAGTGTITTVAGNETRGFSGDSGPATAAELNYPMGVALDGAGNLFIADFGNARIREVLF